MISLIIPMYNVSECLIPIWNQISQSKLSDVVKEILIVNDGSTDDIISVFESIKNKSDPHVDKLKLIHLEKNQGRFVARWEGAKAASSNQILFLDCRVGLPLNFGDQLKDLAPQFKNIVGRVDIDTNRNIFCLYWDRSHQAIFRKHYQEAQVPIFLTSKNYDQYLKGTTVLLCNRELFIKICKQVYDQHGVVLSDDTLVLKEFVNYEQLVIHPRLRIHWVPREDWIGFIWRIWDRSPYFVEYHVFQRRGGFFWIVIAGLLCILSFIFLLIFFPMIALKVFLLILIFMPLSTLFFAKNFREFICLAPLHCAVLMSFGFGILWGILINLKKEFKI